MRRIWIAAGLALALASLGGLLAPLARASIPDGNQGWVWQMPQPAGVLYDVTFGAPSEVWAVGAGGTILHSADAGVSWSSQQSGSFADLVAVSFPDDRHGWTCGQTSSGGVLLVTDNGGASWTARTPAGLSDPPISVSFPDDEHGWLGTYGGHVLRTSNGGSTWKLGRVGNATGMLQVDFVDATHGWVAEADGGRLWHTTNGGASWTLVHDFGGRQLFGCNVDFTDRGHGWASTFLEGPSTFASEVLVTSDGGKVWRTVRRLNDQMVSDLYAAGPSSVSLASISRTWNAPLASAGVTHLWRTGNGGTTWSVQGIGSMVTPWALSGGGDSLCAVGLGIVTSTGSGPWQAASSGQGYTLQGGVAVSDTDIWAVDQAGALLHSTDGSAWTEQATPTRWGQSLSGVSFPDAADGWVVGGTDPFGGLGIILHTSDGGASWSPQSSVLASGLAGVDFVDDTDGWAISSEPDGMGAGAITAIEHTTNGGASWSAQYVPNNPGLYAASFVDAATGWIAGNYWKQSTYDSTEVPLIAKTSDGGATWTQETLPTGCAVPRALQFLDASDGWAVGVNDDGASWLLHTSDGGTSWARVTSLPSWAQADAVRFVDAQHGWVAGQGVWATSDGGQSWTEVAGESGVSALAARDEAHVWAFGDGIVSTVNGADGDTAPPQTLDTADWAWHRKPVTITLSAADTGGSQVAGTTYSTDGGASWQSGTSIAVAAPAGHTNDGPHSFLFRSSDQAGNVEATEICGLGIDTLGPACGAPKEPVAGTGKPAIVRFKAADQTSGVATAAIRIESRSGRVLKTLVAHPGNWSYGPPEVPYLWLRFTCKLKPGLYRIVVRAIDRAGNTQVRVGRSWLRVRARAPKAKTPDWPAGLPDTMTYGGSPRLHEGSGRSLWGRFHTGDAPITGRA